MQNMMLAAWNDGVASCPNGIAEAVRAVPGLGADDAVAVVLIFGYPASRRTGESRSVEEWLAQADRKPLELAERL
jgi:nitroreductase